MGFFLRWKLCAAVVYLRKVQLDDLKRGKEVVVKKKLSTYLPITFPKATHGHFDRRPCPGVGQVEPCLAGVKFEPEVSSFSSVR